MTEEDLARLASRLRTESVLVCVAWLSILRTEQARGQSELPLATQAWIAEALCPARRAALLSVLRDGEHETFIYERQLLLAAKTAILLGQPGPATELGRTAVGDLLLAASDVLNQDALDLMANYTSEGEQSDIGLHIREMAFLRNEQARYAVGRYYDLLITRSTDYKHRPEWVDVQHYFKKQTGLTIEQFKKFAQLRNSIEGLIDGKIVIPDYDMTRLRRIIPVLISLHAFPQAVCRLDVLESELRPHCRIGGLTRVEIRAPQLLTVEECEIIEPLVKSRTIGLAALLSEKTADLGTIHEGMKNYLWIDRQYPEQQNDHVLHLFSVAAEAVSIQVQEDT